MKKHSKKFTQFKKGKLDDYSPVINRAYRLAAYAHREQIRKSGDEYMIHPVSIMNYLRSIEVEESVLVAALLHDTIEDTSITIKDLEDLFGSEVAYIVYFLSKEKAVHFKNKDHRRLVYFEKLEAGFCFNYKIYLIKLVDKLHNLSSLTSFPLEKRNKTIKEAFTVFIPLFKKHLSVVPKKYMKYCEKVIRDMEEIVEDYLIRNG
ncbi:MAG: HD domain-containing protein [bacterium]|nr:HD domain-containing protein [bacterium]